MKVLPVHTAVATFCACLLITGCDSSNSSAPIFPGAGPGNVNSGGLPGAPPLEDATPTTENADPVPGQEQEQEPVYLYVPEEPQIDPAASIQDIDQKTLALLNSLDTLLATAIEQMSDVYTRIGRGEETSSDPEQQQEDINFYNDMVECSPTVDAGQQITLFDCDGEPYSVLFSLRHPVYSDVYLAISEYDKTKGAFGTIRLSLSQAGWQYGNTRAELFTIDASDNGVLPTPDGSYSTEDGGVIDIRRGTDLFACQYGYDPFTFYESNINACAATVTLALEVTQRFNTQ